MSKVKMIRCKTPHDIIVIKDKKNFRAIAEALSRSGENACHPHTIVCGDVWFARPKK